MTMTLRNSLFALVLLGSAGPLSAQIPTVASMDSLLSRMEGQWLMTGTVRGKPAAYRLDVQRVLRGRFIELHMVDMGQPSAYEARVFVGVDSAKAQYIAHWLDNSGAGYSIPHATGQARGDTIHVVFPYPEGAFSDTFVYDPAADAWHFRLDAADGHGGWSVFAEYRLRRR
jgi:hypothetical protein